MYQYLVGTVENVQTVPFESERWRVNMVSDDGSLLSAVCSAALTDTVFFPAVGQRKGPYMMVKALPAPDLYTPALARTVTGDPRIGLSVFQAYVLGGIEPDVEAFVYAYAGFKVCIQSSGAMYVKPAYVAHSINPQIYPETIWSQFIFPPYEMVASA